LISLRQLSGLDVTALLMKNARIALCGAALVATVLLARTVLPFGLWPMAVEIVAGAAVYAALLNLLILPGHLTRIITLARAAMPANGV